MPQINSTAYHTNYDDLISCKDNIFTKKLMEVHRQIGEFYLNILTSDNVVNDNYHYMEYYIDNEGNRIKGRNREYTIPQSYCDSVSTKSVRLLDQLIFFRNSTFYPEWKFKDFGYVSPDEDDTSYCSSTSVLDSPIHEVYHNNLFFITGEKKSSRVVSTHLEKITVFVFKPDLLGQFPYDNCLTYLLTQVFLCSDIANFIDIFGKKVMNTTLYDFGYLDTYFHEYLMRSDIHPYRNIVNGKFEYHVDTVNLLKSACRILDEFGNDEEEKEENSKSKNKYFKPNAISLTLNLSERPDNRYATADIFKFSGAMGYRETNDKMTGLIATTDKMKHEFRDRFSSTLLEILKVHSASLFKTVKSDYTDKIVHTF